MAENCNNINLQRTYIFVREHVGERPWKFIVRKQGNLPNFRTCFI